VSSDLPPASIWIGVISFNRNEMLAVEKLFLDMVNGPKSPWTFTEDRMIERNYGDGVAWILEHVPLLAQGNVVAAAELATFFYLREKEPDFVVFYGCAGAASGKDVGSAFLIEAVNYLSLGTVEKRKDGGEMVTLKNKWLCYTEPPADARPLPLARFPLCSAGEPINFSTLSGIPAARVAAADKVVCVPPSTPPPIAASGPPHDAYSKEKWSYGEALALVTRSNETVLVEMESYGIARLAQALDILDKVLVMRVTTDTLEDHGSTDDDQVALLMEGRHVLARLLLVLFTFGLGPP
jgi:nucleoside phosphorylase